MVHAFPKGISQKVNVIARLEYLLDYYDVTVKPISLYTTETLYTKCIYIYIYIYIYILNYNGRILLYNYINYLNGDIFKNRLSLFPYIVIYGCRRSHFHYLCK